MTLRMARFDRVRTFLRIGVLAFFGIFSVVETARSDHLLVLTTHIPGLHETDLSGEYDQKILQAAETAGIEVEILLLPFTRMTTEFAVCENCCASPCVELASADYCAGAQFSEPWNSASLHIFTRKHSGAVSALDNLDGKPVGLEFGSPVARDMIEEAGATHVAFDDLGSGFQMLKLGRVDAILAWVLDVLVYFDQHQIPVQTYDPNAPLLTVTDRLGCKGQKALDLLKALDPPAPSPTD